ncbi:response regulator [Photobacterium lutimaris]|uniref:Response regulator n=1 Tax=Photobacterium lutimaris TaxID=388278 RepID=A0A2T3IVE5_9GAMM|nr:response regulator [Photobacterium lutimaris]PSU32378.1 response regulator [Photobacterium lutimaris]TDR77576.1 response regulator receiver domain-containing protein [Photobacterium lutimaris]
MEILAQSSYLIIDDSNIIQTTTRALLMKLGVPMNNIISTANAKGAVIACSKRRFDILLIDHNLGTGSTGLQLLEYLHHKKLISRRTLVFIVTGDDSQDVFFGYSQHEPDGYLIKPIRSGDIIKRVSAGLLKREYCDTLQQAYINKGLPSVKPLFAKAPETAALKSGILFVADLLTEQQQYDDAQAMLAGLLQVHNHLPAKIKQAEIHVVQKNYKQALDQINQLIKANPFNVSLLKLKTTICILTEQWEEVEASIHRHIQLHSGNIEQTLTLIWVHLIHQEQDKAIPLLVKTAQLLPHSMWDTPGRRGMILFADLLSLQQKKDSSGLVNWRLDGAWSRLCNDPKSKLRGKGAQKALLAIQALMIDQPEKAQSILAVIEENEVTDTETVFLISWAFSQLDMPEKLPRYQQLPHNNQTPVSEGLANLQHIAVANLAKPNATGVKNEIVLDETT